MSLDEGGAIDVDDGNEVEDVGGEHLLILRRVLDVPLMEELEAQVQWHLG